MHDWKLFLWRSATDDQTSILVTYGPKPFPSIFIPLSIANFVIAWPRWKYKVIHKSLRDFRPLRYSSRDGHVEGEHVNRGRDTPSFCPTLQVLDMSTLADAADVNPVIKFLSHMLHVCGRNFITGFTSAASSRVDISSTCKVGEKYGVSLPLLTCSPSAWPCRLLYRSGRKSRKDLWITLYYVAQIMPYNSTGVTEKPLQS